MFLKSPLLAPTSGFVAFDGGGADVADRATVRSPARVRATPELPAAPADVELAPAEGMRQSATWEPAYALRTRRVEGLLIIAVCAYFVLGLVRLVGWI